MPFIANIAAKFAGKYLGEYFDGVEKKNIEASLISGETIFRGLTLKPSALDQFNLPVEIKEGTLAKLVLKIPWTSLGTEPTIVRIEEFYITLGPKPRSSQTAAKSDEMALARKKQRLKLAALLRQDQPAEDKARIKQEKKKEKKERRKDEGKMSLAQTLQKKVLANLQLFIDKIHIRYEDNTTNPEQAFCFGITLEKFHAQTANADWEPTIVKMKEQIVHKLVELRNLSFYFDTPKERGAVMLRSKNSTTAKLMNLHLFQDGMPPPEHNYIISPLSGTMRLRTDLRRDNLIDYSIPKLSCEVTLESAGFSVNKVQYSAAMEFLQYCQAYQKSAKYLRYRPDFENAPNKARAYWKYALDCVLADVRKNYQGWTWDSIMARKKDRLLYVQLYTKRQSDGKKKMLADELAEMERIEAKYSFDDLVLYRKLANTTIMNTKKAKKDEEKKDKSKKEKKDKKDKDKDKEKDKDKKKEEKEKAKAEKKEEKEREKAEKKSGKKSSNIIAALNSQTGSNFDNEDVMDELYYSLGLQQEHEAQNGPTTSASTGGPPPGYVKTELKFCLGTATFSLSELPSVESRLASVVTKDASVHVAIRDGGSLTVSGSVGKFNVFDYHTLGGRELATLRPDPRVDTSHPLALFVFDRNPLDISVPETTVPEPSSRTTSLAPVPGGLVLPASSKTSIRSSSPTASSSSPTPPPPPATAPVKVDYRIKFVAYPIYVTVSRPFIDRVLAFFKVSKGKSKKVGANVANKAASKIKKAGQKNLQKALKKRKVTQIDIDFLAPRIIVPESFVGDDCASMIIDFGHLVAKTTGPPPIPAHLTGAARSQAKKEAAIYDHYDISVKGITSYFVWSQSELDQLITGGVSRGKKSSKYSADDIAGGASPNTLLRRLDVQVYAKLLSRAPTGKLPRLKVEGSMSGLELDLSTERVGALMGAIRAATKKTTAKQHADLIKAKTVYLDTRGGRGANASTATPKKLKIDQSDLIKALESADAESSAAKKKTKSEGFDAPKRAKPYKLAVAVSFEIPSVSVVVHHQFGHNPIPVPLVSASLHTAKFRMIKSTHDMRVAIRLHGLYVDDQFLVRSGLARADRGPYYIINTINQRGHALVQLDFTQINKKSPLWTGVTNNLKVELNTLEVNINRPTLAALVATISEYVSAMKAAKPVTATATSAIEAIKASSQQNSPRRSPVSTEGNSGDDITENDTATWSAATASLGAALVTSTRTMTSRSNPTDLKTATMASHTATTSQTSTTSTSAEMFTAQDATFADVTDYTLTSMSTAAAPKIDLKAQLALLAKEHEKQQEAQGTQKKKSTSKAPDKRSALRVELTITMVRINFNRHTKTWFVARIGDIGVQLTRHIDGTMVVSGFLGAISARDKNEIRWHDIVSISSDEAASFKFEQFRPTLSDYPGYKHSLHVHVASIRIVILQRLLKELSKYFGGVSKMKKFASAATGIKPTEASTALELQRKLEEVEAKRIAAEKKKKKKSKKDGEKSAMRLQIELGNPLLIIPKTGQDPEHLQLDLGRIMVTNTFGVQGNDVKVDEINIAATGLNIRAFVKDDTTTAKRLVGRTILSDVTMNAQVIRPLANNQDFSVPDVQLIANMSKFDIFISENELALILGTISGNISEFPLRPDDEMDIVLKYLENAHLGEWLEQQPETSTAEPPSKKESKSAQKAKISSPRTEPLTNGSENGSLALQTISSATSSSSSSKGPLAKDARRVLDQVTRIKLLVRLNFDQLSGTIFRGSGTDYLGTPTALARIHLNSFRLSFAQQADKGKVIKLALLNIILEDAAIDTRNQFRRLLASNPKDREEVTSSNPPTSARRSNASLPNDHDSDSDEDGDSAARAEARRKRAQQRKAAAEDSDFPSEIENSLYLVYEARPKTERYEVVSIKINRPRIYVVPSACAALILFVRPLIKIALRSISIFGKRNRLGSLGDQRRLATSQVERAHQQMQREIQELQTAQEAELEALIGDHGKPKKHAAQEKLALKKSENSAAMAKLKAELETSFATLVAEVGKKKRSGIPKERTVKVSLRYPEICVLEDPERSRNVFILHLSDANIKTHMIGKNQTIGLHLFELDARKGQVDPMTNETSERILLIQPFDVVTKLEIVNEQETKLNNIKIKIGVIHTIVSYRDMKLAMAVIRGFGTVGKGFSASKQAVAKTVAANSITPLKRYGVTDSMAKSKASKIKPQLVLVFKIRVMNFTLLNDTNRLFVTPLLKIDVEGIENFLTRGQDMRLNLELHSIKCQAYNIDLAAYEPIVEPWGLDVLLKKEGKATTVNIKAETLLSINLTRSLLDTVFNTMRFFSALSKKKKREGSGPDIRVPAPALPTLSITQSDDSHSNTQSLATSGLVPPPLKYSSDKHSSTTSLNTLAMPSGSVTNLTGGLMAPNSISPTGSVQSAERSFYPFIISNGTCKPIKFWFSHMNEDSAQYLEPEVECPIIIEKSSKQLLSGVGDDESSKFDIDVEIFFYEDDNSHQFTPVTPGPRRHKSVVLHKIPIDRVHSAKTYSLPGEFSNVQFVSENARRGGTKILTLRTTQNIINNTAHDVELLISRPHSSGSVLSIHSAAPSSVKKPAATDKHRQHRLDAHSIVIASGKSKSIPLEFLNYSSIKLRTAGYDWCEWSNRASVFGICRRMPEASRRNATNDYWSCVIVYDRIEDDFATYVSITLHPALQFENLLASMVLIKILQPGENPDDVQNVVDVDAGKDVAIYQSHVGAAKGDSNYGMTSQMMADKNRVELPSTNGDVYTQLTHQRFSICVGGFYWSEPIDLLQLYIAAATFKPGPQDKTAYERTMEVRDVNNRSLSFIAEVTEPMKGCMKITLYAQYWIINQTGLKLNYRINGRSPTLVDDNSRSTEIKGDPRGWYRENDRENGSTSASSSLLTSQSSYSGSGASGASSAQTGPDGKKSMFVGPGKWRLAAPTKFYFSGDEFQAQVAGYGTTEVQQGKIATVLNTAMDKLGAGNGASQWSNSLPLADRDSKKHNTDIDHMTMPDVKTPRIFEFHCSVKHAPGKFWRTQEIRISPQYVLVNKTKRHLVYRQVDQVEATTGSNAVKNEHLATCDLMAGDQLPFHWPDASLLAKQLSINYSNDDPGLNDLRDSDGNFLDPNIAQPETHWSGRFSIDAIDNFMVKIRDKTEVERFDLINVSIKERRGIKYVIFREGSEDFIQLIRVENQSEWEIVVEQKLRVNTSTTSASTETNSPVLSSSTDLTSAPSSPGPSGSAEAGPKSHVHFIETVPLRTIQPYYWDEPHKRTKVLLLHVKPPPGTPLSRNSFYSISSLAEDASAGVDEYIYGWKANSRQRFKVQVQVRGFTKVVVVTSAGASSEDIPEDGQMAEASPQQRHEEDKSSVNLEMDFAGIGLSVIDSFPQEIFYVSMKHATLKYRRVGKVHSFGFTAKSGQVDNQLYLAPDPLMVYGLKTDPAPFLSLNIDIDTTEKKIIYFTKLHMMVQRLELNVDQIAILAAAAFSSIASKAIKQQKMIQNVAFVVEDVIPILADKYMRSDKYYFQNINLEAIKSFFSLRRATNKRLLPIVNQRLKRALTTVLKISSIERQKLVFSGFEVPSAFSSLKDMQRRVVKHYKSVVMSNISSLLLNYVTKVVRTMWSGSIQPPVVQMRPPRFFPPDDLVVLYDRPLAYGQKLLRCICEGAFYKEHYYFHYFISGQELVLSSHKWLMMCRSSEYDALSFAIIWKEKLDDIISFVAPASETNIKIIFDPHTGDDPHFREIYCRTTEQSAFIASKIESAVSRNKFSSLTSIRRSGEDAD